MKLIDKVKSMENIQINEGLGYMDQIKIFYMEINNKIEGNWNDNRSMPLSS